MLTATVTSMNIQTHESKPIMNRTWHLRIRKTHRYLGLFIGVQFLLWTLGGLYFSWSKLDDIHGDHLKRPPDTQPISMSLVSPSVPLAHLEQQGVGFVSSVQLVDIVGQPVYQIAYQVDHKGHPMSHTQLADARTGRLRSKLTQAEAVAVAKGRFAGKAFVEQVEYLTSTNGHHEYRAKPLPAYAVTFSQPSHATVYVAANLGTVQSVRTDAWRVFDLLWMLHTMDYNGRDDFNNSLLRAFSLLGLLTISSGFALYFISSPQLRKGKKAQKGTLAKL